MIQFREAVIEKTTHAMSKVFNNSYPDPLLRSAYVGPAFPMTREQIPAIIILFQDNKVQNMGMGHILNGTSATTGAFVRVHQWRFEGQLQFEVTGYTSIDRTKIADQLVNLLAFGYDSSIFKPFWDEIWDEEFIAMTMLTDSLTHGFPSEIPSPWGEENELLYKSQVSCGVTGEFYSDSTTGGLVQISAVNLYPYRDSQNPPQGTGDPNPWQT